MNFSRDRTFLQEAHIVFYHHPTSAPPLPPNNSWKTPPAHKIVKNPPSSLSSSVSDVLESSIPIIIHHRSPFTNHHSHSSESSASYPAANQQPECQLPSNHRVLGASSQVVIGDPIRRHRVAQGGTGRHRPPGILVKWARKSKKINENR